MSSYSPHRIPPSPPCSRRLTRIFDDDVASSHFWKCDNDDDDDDDHSLIELMSSQIERVSFTILNWRLVNETKLTLFIIFIASTSSSVTSASASVYFVEKKTQLYYRTADATRTTNNPFIKNDDFIRAAAVAAYIIMSIACYFPCSVKYKYIKLQTFSF
mgnify:CR=1 FL=1